MVFEAVSASHHSKLPLADASKIPKCVTVPHEPVAVTNVIAFALLIDPPEAAAQSAPAVCLRT
jgi:hypothetical protein